MINVYNEKQQPMEDPHDNKKQSVPKPTHLNQTDFPIPGYPTELKPPGLYH